MSTEVVARQFFMDFLENLGDDYADEGFYRADYTEEEANMILTDWFFSGTLQMKWDPRKIRLILNYLGEDNKPRTRKSRSRK